MSIKDVNLAKKFGMKVRIERVKRGLSQDKLAEFAGLNKNSIGSIERGARSPTLDTINSIAKAFEISLLEVLNVENE